MREEIVGRVRAAMDATGLDAIIAISPENFAYLTGFVVPSQADLRWRHAAAVVCADGGKCARWLMRGRISRQLSRTGARSPCQPTASSGL